MKLRPLGKSLIPGRFTPAGVSLLYAAFAALWVIVSGNLLTHTAQDPLLLSRIELAKGLSFVAVTGSLLYLMLRGWREYFAAQQTTTSSYDIVPPKTTRQVLLFIALVLVVPLIDFAVFKLHVPHVELGTYNNLKSIAELKAEEIENWLNERRGDAQGLAVNEEFARQVEHFILYRKNDARLPRQVLNVLGSMQANHGFDSIMLLDTGGRLLSSIGADVDIPDSLRIQLRQSLNSRQVQFNDLYRDMEGDIHLEWAVPLVVSDPQGKRVVAVAVLRVTAQRFIFPLIQTWPTASASGETLLVRRDGESVVYLNELQHHKDSALRLTLPLTDVAQPAVVAIRSAEPGTVQGKDYRDMQVLAAYRPVAGTDWHIVAKIDRDEVLMPVWDMLYWISLIASVASAFIMAVFVMLMRQQQRTHQLALLARSAEVLRESELRFRAVTQSASDAIVTVDSSGNIVDWNPSTEQTFGYTEAEIKGQHLTKFIPERFRDLHRESLARVASGGETRITGKTVEIAGLRKDGGEFPLEISLAQWQTAAGRFFTGTMRDITERKLAEDSLRKLSQAVEQSPSTIIITDLSGNIEYANPAFVKESGYSLAEAIGKNPHLLYSGNTPKSTYADMWSHLTRGETWKGEFINRRKDGSEYIEGALISPVFQADGRMTHYLAIKENVTERRQAEDALRDSRESLNLLLNSMAEGAYGVDNNGNCTFVNRAFLEMLGYQNDNEVLGKHIHELMHYSLPDGSPYPESECRVCEAYRTNQSSNVTDEVFWRKDGVAIPVEYWSHPIVSDGVVIGAIATFVDITGRKAADTKIHRLTQLYATLSQCNEAIVRSTSMEELFPQICRAAVQYGGMKMAWIGLVDEASKRVRPVASYGTDTEYLDGIQITVEPGDPFGHGPIGTAIRDNQPSWCQDFQHSPAMAPWRKRIIKAGWKSAASLPLLRNGTPIGTLTLYADTLNAFDDDARRLLLEMAMDISFALDNFAREARRKRAEQDLIDSEQRFRGLVEQSLAGICIIQNGILAYVNPRSVEILGQGTAHELLGLDPLQFTAEADRGKVAESIRQLHDKEAQSIALEFSVLRQDGVTTTVGASVSAAIYHGREAIIGQIQDISEKKRDEERIQRYVTQLEHAFMNTIEVATTLLEMRDPYTAGHEKRVAQIAVAIATELGLDAHRIEGLRVGGYIHDIGKIIVPAEILTKPRRLTAAEYELVKGHPQAGYDILKNVDFPWPVADIAYQHHERMDGSGYPRGLKGEEILLEARITAVADVVETMASHRPYRAGLGIEQALAEIEGGSGTLYDPVIVEICLRLFRKQGYELPAL
jgi:PAS domain S-box-containing protein/putative nucleotidyltransferase with HDIG domain